MKLFAACLMYKERLEVFYFKMIGNGSDPPSPPPLIAKIVKLLGP